MTAALAGRLAGLLDGWHIHPYPPDPESFGIKPSAITTDNYLTVWRSVLAAPDSPEHAAWFKQLASDLPREPQELGEVALAARYRQGLPPPPLDLEHEDEFGWRFALAALEGSPTKSADLVLSDTMPHLLRPTAVRVASNADPDWLYDTLRLDDRPSTRDLAVRFAADHLGEEQVDTLIERLLEDPDPDGRMSAAMLSGVTGRQARLLHDWAGREQRFAVQRMMQVGLWMQGLADEMTPVLPAMLAREDLPETTLRFALLHGGQPRPALDELLGPQADLGVALELLGRERWWHVLRAYLPEGAAKFDLWADGQVAKEQLKILQAQWLLHRYDVAVPTTNTHKAQPDAQNR
jgi:hypothetical protein